MANVFVVFLFLHMLLKRLRLIVSPKSKLCTLCNKGFTVAYPACICIWFWMFLLFLIHPNLNATVKVSYQRIRNSFVSVVKFLMKHV